MAYFLKQIFTFSYQQKEEKKKYQNVIGSKVIEFKRL